MNTKKIALPFFIIVALLFTLSGCGYKPTAYYAKKGISGKVYVDLKIDIENSQNAVFAKDALNDIILSKFKSQIVKNKKDADKLLNIELKNISHTAIQTDSEGYTKLYRADATIAVSYKDNSSNAKVTKSDFTNYHYYNVDKNSIVTDTQKQEAVKVAVSNGLNDFFSKIAVKNFK